MSNVIDLMPHIEDKRAMDNFKQAEKALEELKKNKFHTDKCPTFNDKVREDIVKYIREGRLDASTPRK